MAAIEDQNDRPASLRGQGVPAPILVFEVEIGSDVAGSGGCRSLLALCG